MDVLSSAVPKRWRGIYPFTDDCQRLEHARLSVNRPSNESYGHADDTVDFVTLKAKQQYALGMMGYISGVRDRRVLVVDIERGAVLVPVASTSTAMTRRINLTGRRRLRDIPPYFRTPRTHHMNEAFKVQNGSYRFIEMMLLEVPFGTRPVWRKVPTSTQEPVSVRPPAQPHASLPNRARAHPVGGPYSWRHWSVAVPATSPWPTTLNTPRTAYVSNSAMDCGSPSAVAAAIAFT